jgi:acyl-CoA hydrolase
MSAALANVDAAVAIILDRIGPTVVLGIPLGLGKPVPLVNALYRRAQADPALKLRILTALTLEKPRGTSAIERAFLEPFVQRVYADCPDPEYQAALRENRLPPNVEVSEFFFRPGSMLGSAHAQQHYVSSNYTHAARDVLAQGCNVVAQMVARRVVDGETRYSLSCNPDTGLELIERLRASGRTFLSVAMVNAQLPYLEGHAEVPGDFFDLVVDAPQYSHTLFSTPKLPVATPDFWVGLHASALVRDGGTLQVGIGSLGDAVVHALLLRHANNPVWRGLLDEAGADKALGEAIGGSAPFEEGLYGASEMLVDGFMQLHRAGILKRQVYGFWALQQLVNDGRCVPLRLAPRLFEDFESLGLRVIRGQDFAVLQHHGVFTDATRYDQGFIVAPGGERVIANVADPATRRVLGEQCLGQALRNGTVVSAAFFLGTREFYQWLRELPGEERRAISMTAVARINQLDLNPRLYQLQRQHARFMNTGLMVTLGGAIVSDGLEDGRVISGVGGQYNFIAMAHQLATGRSILMVRATREGGDGGATSNIVFNYGHTTIPRHLRDLVVTEYGVADLRSKNDRDVIAALLNVADSRFQDGLLARAVAAGKIERGYRIPDAHRDNTPQRLERQLAPRVALFPPFPLGSDFTPEEQVLVGALQGLKARAAGNRLKMLWAALSVREVPAAALPYLARLQLDAPADFQARVARRLLVLELRERGVVA